MLSSWCIYLTPQPLRFVSLSFHDLFVVQTYVPSICCNFVKMCLIAIFSLNILRFQNTPNDALGVWYDTLGSSKCLNILYFYYEFGKYSI